MVGWHHQLDGHGFEQARGDGDGQGGLVCYSPWGHNKSDMTEQVNNKYTTTTESRPGHNITEGHKVGKRLEGGKDSQAAGETQAPVGAEGQAGAVGRRAGRQLRGRLWRRTHGARRLRRVD